MTIIIYIFIIVTIYYSNTICHNQSLFLWV